MAQVNHYSQTVHFLDYLFSKCAHTIMCVVSTGRIADVIIAIMTESDIYYSSVGKMLHVLDVMIKSKTVLNAKHDTLLAQMLVGIQVGWCSCYADIIFAFINYRFYLVKDVVGKGAWTSLELFSLLRLRKISHHGNGICAAFGHFVKVIQNLWVTMTELYSLWEEHWSVAMAVKSKNFAMQSFCLCEF